MLDRATLKARLRIPAIAAPMFLVSGPDLVLAACRAGIVGSFPANNARTLADLDAWLERISTEAAGLGAPWALNLVMHRTYERGDDEFQRLLRYRPPIVITALGSPRRVVAAVHDYGGLVLADVNTVAFARKAAETGVDGLVLVCAGAGGHTGLLSPFAFVPAVREFFDGIVVVGGAIGDGAALRAAELIGGDFGYLGTRLIATAESLAVPAYKRMLVDASADDVVLSASLTGVAANWLRPSLVAAGFDPGALGPKAEIELGRPEKADAKRWRDVWSAGQGVGAVRAVEPLQVVVDRIAAEYRSARGPQAAA